MVAGFGTHYILRFPSGSTERRTLLGPPKQRGEIIELDKVGWRIRSVKQVAEPDSADFELELVPK